ncbi:MAG: hypothetical protein ACRDTR_00105 [Rubrobacter sp.]
MVEIANGEGVKKSPLAATVASAVVGVLTFGLGLVAVIVLAAFAAVLAVVALVATLFPENRSRRI